MRCLPRSVVLSGLVVVIVFGLVALGGCGGTPTTVVTVTASPGSTAALDSASGSLEGWWVEADPVTGEGWSPSLFYVKKMDGGDYGVSYQSGVMEGITFDSETFALAESSSGVYEATDSSDYTLEVSDANTVTLTWNGSDNPLPTQFSRATEDEATAAVAAADEAEAAGASGSGGNGSSGLSSGEYKGKCRQVKFKVLEKDADSLAGRRYTFKGQVFQIQDAGNGSYSPEFEEAGYDVQPQTQVLLSVTSEGYGYWSDEIMVLYDDRMKRVYEEDIIQVWGECLGTYTYESVAGYTMTVPLIHAKYYDKK